MKLDPTGTPTAATRAYAPTHAPRVKLAAALRYLSRDDFRVLTACVCVAFVTGTRARARTHTRTKANTTRRDSVEIGQKNHDLVPRELIAQIADLRHGGTEKMLQTCLRHKLLHHETHGFDGYRLTTLGYDFLALRALVAKGLVSGVGKKLGVGKESDIFLVQNDEGTPMVLKLHRLGRTSFRKIKAKRDYHGERGSPSWLYLSRLAAQKEFSFMKALKGAGFPVPDPIEANRHCILMSLLEGYPLHMVHDIDAPQRTAQRMLDLIVRLGQHGLIHGDFNEFNVAIAKDDAAELVMYDFPQMVSMSHPNARMYFERDVNCVTRFFRTRFDLVLDGEPPSFDQVFAQRVKALDVQVSVSGFSKKDAQMFDRLLKQEAEAKAAAPSSSSDGASSSEGDGAVDQDEEATGDGVDVALDDDDDEACDEEEGRRQAHDDGPQAYLAHDYVVAGDEHEPGVQKYSRRFGAPALSVKERVASEVQGRVRREQRSGKSSRNTIKSRERRRVKEMME